MSLCVRASHHHLRRHFLMSDDRVTADSLRSNSTTPYTSHLTMIIDAKTIILTLILVSIAFYFGLKFIRAFALSIAQQQHDANVAMDQEEQEQRVKREKQADAAAASAYAKVEPLLTMTKEEKKASGKEPEASAKSDSVDDTI